MKGLTSTLAGAAIALSGLAAAPTAAQTQATAINDIQQDTVKGRTWDRFVELVEEKLGDGMDIRVSHGEALYDQKTIVQALQLGAVQFISPVVGVYSGTFPKLSVFVLPYLMPSPEAIRAVMDDPELGGALLDEMRAQGIEPLAIWLNGPRDIGRTGSTPILEPGDMQGVKIRVPPGRNYVEAFELLDANVTTMSWGEVPTALRQGVIDAVEPVPHAWLASSMYETAQQITKTEYIWDFYIVATNKPWWDGLDAETRDALSAAMDEATAWNWENTNAENAAALEEMAAAGATIHDLTPEQRGAWAEAMRPLWDDLGRELVGDGPMDRIIEITDEYR
ncbi:TRAP transporter substrate-binding protein [Roseitranquillus sediminis]|uniref:TRAP transporter substrate-binding protein n=1 Tax=Roseitranquillus sediminis TaxID=2809051 RepID=UPI001D0C91FB|nr:TRAP transporter substrate-binding protein [Roseitranquillus sediminis]MBM9593885.1 TRAP transporter substrate-binding protein [Roseitranquillus sediminis]